MAINGLPAGAYGVMYTTDAEFGAQQNNISIQVGETLRTAIPDAGVITIYSIDTAFANITPTTEAITPSVPTTIPTVTAPSMGTISPIPLQTSTITSPVHLNVPTELPRVQPFLSTAQSTPAIAVQTPVVSSRPGCSGSIPKKH
jgi:hypothetical protein